MSKIRRTIETLAKARYGRDEIYTYHRDPNGGDNRLREFHVSTLNTREFAFRYGWWWRPKDRYLRVMFGRNGDESDIGLDVCLLGLHWFARLKAPWTARFRVTDKTIDAWYEPRHTGFDIGRVYLCSWEIDVPDNWGGKDVPKWRRFTLSKWQVLGRVKSDSVIVDHGVVDVEMPEGVYPANWETTSTTRRYVRWPGKVLNRWEAIKDAARPLSLKIEVPGGIPVWGKGENSWDCGMDAVYATHKRLEGSVGDEAWVFAASMMAQRERTGMFELPRPMTCGEAEEFLVPKVER